jgi:hypothetical protein
MANSDISPDIYTMLPRMDSAQSLMPNFSEAFKARADARGQGLVGAGGEIENGGTTAYTGHRTRSFNKFANRRKLFRLYSSRTRNTKIAKQTCSTATTMYFQKGSTVQTFHRVIGVSI